jgi:hypothetical protein
MFVQRFTLEPAPTHNGLDFFTADDGLPIISRCRSVVSEVGRVIDHMERFAQGRFLDIK